MADDIVKRLLKVAAISEIIKDNPKIYYDAADAIIRLREHLAEADEANRRVSDENEKLRHELITSSDAAKYYNYGYSCARDMQKDEIERLRAENEKLREALKPFAYYASQIPEDVSNTASASGTVGDLRAAAAAIRESGDE